MGMCSLTVRRIIIHQRPFIIILRAHHKGMIVIKKIFPALLFIYAMCLQHIVIAQDSTYVNHLVQRIAALQSKSNGAFVKGLFPSYITGKEQFSAKKADNNIFYNGLTAYIISGVRHRLSPANQTIMDSVVEQAKPAFARFKNRKGRDTYNFWRTDTPFHYPYIGLVNLFMKQTALPDDMDDTVLSLLALGADDSTAAAVHDLMQQYVNSDTADLRTVINAYEQYPAYSTWFGKKFPVVFDVAVLCNVLSFVQHYNLPWTKADSASLQLILETVTRDYHIYQPLYAAPYYPKTSIILYHLARLMHIKPIPALEAIQPQLIIDASEQFDQSNNILEKVILGTALMKWGVQSPVVQLPALQDLDKEIEENDFSFFAGNVPSYFAGWLRKFTSSNNWFIYYHYCPAFNNALLLEYLLLRQKM